MTAKNRLAIGAVQFGLPYGVANQSGQVDKDEAALILSYARKAGLDTVDTAIVYGESEQRLGEIGIEQWQIITKLPPMPENLKNVSTWVDESVSASMSRLQISKLRGLLLHDSQQLLGSQGQALYNALLKLKELGKVEKIGISIYSPDELDALLPHFKLDLVQAPFNIIDRRLSESGWLKRLHMYGVEIHVRSVFLQGLLLLENNKYPKYFSRWNTLWAHWHSWLDEQSISALQACLSFVNSHPEISRVIVGVDSLKQLQGILDNIDDTQIIPPKTLQSDDIELINPSRWNES